MYYYHRFTKREAEARALISLRSRTSEWQSRVRTPVVSFRNLHVHLRPPEAEGCSEASGAARGVSSLAAAPLGVAARPLTSINLHSLAY